MPQKYIDEITEGKLTKIETIPEIIAQMEEVEKNITYLSDMNGIINVEPTGGLGKDKPLLGI